MDRIATWLGASILSTAIIVMLGLAAALLAGEDARPARAHHDDGPSPKFYLDCPKTHVEEGDSLRVFEVRTDLNGHEQFYFGRYWHTDAYTANGFDYPHLDGVWQASTNAERRANRMARTITTYEDTRLEGEETFTVSFTPTVDVKDHDDPERDARCEITIVDDEAKVTGINVISRPTRGQVYGWRETIEFAVTFDRKVVVEGRPLMGIWVGSQWRAAKYQRGSGTDTLVFGYSVSREDRDGDGVRVHDGYHDGSRWHGFGRSSVIKVEGTEVEVSRLYRGIGDLSGNRVDGSLLRDAIGMRIISEPAFGDTYHLGEDIEIEIRYRESVITTGRKGIAIRVGDNAAGQANYRAARYSRGSGTDRIVYAYTVRKDDLDFTGIRVDRGAPGSGYTRDGAIYFIEEESAPVDIYYAGLATLAGHKVDGRVSPTVSSVSITSDPGDDFTYGYGDDVQVTVTFDAKLVVSGSPEIQLDVGGIPKPARLDFVAGDSLVFVYTVAEDDSDSDGLSIDANRLTLNGGEIAGRTGNPAVLRHDAVPTDIGHRVDGRGPVFVSATTTADGTGIDVTLDETVDFSRLIEWLAAHPDLQIQHFFQRILDVTVDGDPAEAVNLSLLGDRLVVTLLHPIIAGQIVHVSYDNNFARDSRGLLADAAANPVALFSNRTVANVSTAEETTADSDSDSIEISVAELDMAEGGTAAYSVSLATRPDSDVAVAVTVDPPTSRLTANVSTLSFTRDNWSHGQEVILTSVEDTSSSKFWGVVIHTATGGGYDDETSSLRVTIQDNGQ